MELSSEAYRLIINYVDNRSDICTLCRTSKGFQHVAERALYNTIYMQNPITAMAICNTLTAQSRVAGFVDALTVCEADEEDGDDVESSLPHEYWETIASALRTTVQLRHLNVHICASGHRDSSKSWILNGCTFRLRSFHCDLSWDRDLIGFLNAQPELVDLYIGDFNDFDNNIADTFIATVSTASSYSLHPDSMPNLSILECTFSEAAVALVPSRPITHLKTCFSRSRVDEKRAEMLLLLSKLQLSTGHFQSLDIADSSYHETFSLEFLASLTDTIPTSNLYYLGTLVLPINARERLRFYGLLRRLSQLRCIEVEISEWKPAPRSRAALRALTTELRLYCPSVILVVFVYEFERMVITVVNGVCHMDDGMETDNLWREF